MGFALHRGARLLSARARGGALAASGGREGPDAGDLAALPPRPILRSRDSAGSGRLRGVGGVRSLERQALDAPERPEGSGATMGGRSPRRAQDLPAHDAPWLRGCVPDDALLP